MGNPIESTLKLEIKGMDVNLPLEPTSLICVTRRMIRADLNFKQNFKGMSFRLRILKLKKCPISKLQ